jgi:hypothetical protein
MRQIGAGFRLTIGCRDETPTIGPETFRSVDTLTLGMTLDIAWRSVACVEVASTIRLSDPPPGLGLTDGRLAAAED